MWSESNVNNTEILAVEKDLGVQWVTKLGIPSYE